jgi:hypothetical protein
MTEYTEMFDVVLYFNRRVFVKPKEPVFEDIQKSNPTLDTDNILDIYSDLNKKYKNDLEKYEMLENKDLIVTGCVLIPEDEHFIKNYRSIEKDDFFVEWTDSSKNIINSTISNLLR